MKCSLKSTIVLCLWITLLSACSTSVPRIQYQGTAIAVGAPQDGRIRSLDLGVFDSFQDCYLFSQDTLMVSKKQFERTYPGKPFPTIDVECRKVVK